MPLAESRGGASGGVWGNAPTVPRATNSKDEVNKGAGSEASLPVTLRFLRSAPKPLYLPLAYCRADGRDRPVSREVFSCCWSFLLQGDAPAGATRGQWKQTKSAVAPLTPSGAPPCFLIFYWKFFSYCPAFFPGFYSFAQGDNHHVRIYRRSCVRKNDQFLSS